MSLKQNDNYNEHMLEMGFCPQCKRMLAIAENANNGVVFQRVVSCDNCGYVYKFDADENDPVVEAIKENIEEARSITAYEF